MKRKFNRNQKRITPWDIQLSCLTPLIQLTAFTTFETCSKLNVLCCNYVNFSHLSSFLSLKIFFFQSSYQKNSRTSSQKFIRVRTNQDQIFDDKTDYKCCVKNLLSFLNSNVAGERIDKKLNYLQGIILEIKSNNKWRSLFSLFFYLLQSKSKWFSLQQFLFETDNSFHKLLPITFMYILLFLFQKHTI